MSALKLISYFRYGGLLDGKVLSSPKKQATGSSYPAYMLLSRLGNGRKLLPSLLAKGGKTSSASYGLLGVSCVIIDHSV